MLLCAADVPATWGCASVGEDVKVLGGSRGLEDSDEAESVDGWFGDPWACWCGASLAAGGTSGSCSDTTDSSSEEAGASVELSSGAGQVFTACSACAVSLEGESGTLTPLDAAVPLACDVVKACAAAGAVSSSPSPFECFATVSTAVQSTFPASLQGTAGQDTLVITAWCFFVLGFLFVLLDFALAGKPAAAFLGEAFIELDAVVNTETSAGTEVATGAGNDTQLTVAIWLLTVVGLGGWLRDKCKQLCPAICEML